MALEGLLAALEDTARRLVQAQLAERQLAPRDPARRWRSARLIWPLFTRG